MIYKGLFCFQFIFIVKCGLCAPVRSKFHQIASVTVLDFMKKYGYLQMDNGNSEALYREERIYETIKLMQRYGGIEETGIFDEETQKLVTLPRCGVPDIIRSKRERRYVLGPEKWKKRNISYFLSNWSPKLGEQLVQNNIQQALDIWGGYGRLSFYRKYTQDADIIVAFAQGYHGDSIPFDGPGKILAHAFFPQENNDQGGDIHFDADEYWVEKSTEDDDLSDGTDFFTVALHELGHSLGLAHSSVQNSIMFPYYQELENGVRLGYDDILAMYDMYIRNTLKDDNKVFTTYVDEHPEETTEISESSSTTMSNNYTISTNSIYSNEDSTYTDTSMQTDVTEFISTTASYNSTEISTTSMNFNFNEDSTTSTDESFLTDDWLFTSSEDNTASKGLSTEIEDHSTVVFADDDYKSIQTNDETYISNSNSNHPDICDGHFDCIAMLRDELYVFRDEYLWRFQDMRVLREGYPVKLKDMFSELPDNVNKIDAAYQRPDGMIVLFTGSIFWVYDGEKFIENSPKSLTHYGLPEYVTELDAAQNWNRNQKTYFYKDDRFWRYNEFTKEMDPDYPQHINKWGGVPPHLDGSTTWKDGVTYFFRSGLYWKFDNNWIMVTEESPMPTPTIWYGCSENNNSVMQWFQ